MALLLLTTAKEWVGVDPLTLNRLKLLEETLPSVAANRTGKRAQHSSVALNGNRSNKPSTNRAAL
jgi:hypothetical protein